MSSRPSDSDTTPVEEDIPAIVQQVRRDMGDTWQQDDQLLDKFFPFRHASNSAYQTIRNELYNDNKHRWKGIYVKARLSDLYRHLTHLMNRILFHYGIKSDERRFFDTHPKRCRAASTAMDVSPGIFLSGVGSEFANLVKDEVRPLYAEGISAFEVSLASEDLTAARDRLAVHVHRIFQHQDNRRFVYGLVITQNTFTVYMFDHSGAVASEPCDYHAHPDRFCAVISGLASKKARIGFDNTIFGDGIKTTIRTFESSDGSLAKRSHYTIQSRLFQFSSLVGRGTICWYTSGPGNGAFVIKDAWVAPPEVTGRESEGSLLRHAQSAGLLTGIAQVRHFEEVRRGADVSDLDTVLRNRQAKDIPDQRHLERVHTRIILETHGHTLDKFTTKRELLLAFHDAVVGHRQLHDLAGILHRDISIRNILINPDGAEGNHGVLIDFDHAIRVHDTSPYSTQKKIGTWRYMSRNVLEGTGPHTYLDDLESFYYVFTWILAAFDGPRRLNKEISSLVAAWDDRGSSSIKGGLMNREFALPVSPWFGTSLKSLAAHLHRFFRLRFDIVGKSLSSLDPTKDYEEFLAHIQQAMTDLETELDSHSETSAQTDTPLPSDEPTQAISRKRRLEVGGIGESNVSSHPLLRHQSPAHRQTRSMTKRHKVNRGGQPDMQSTQLPHRSRRHMRRQ